MKETSYESALAELQQIVNELQSETVSIDELETKARRAAELIRYCREKLRHTEEAIGQLFAEENE